MLPVCIAGVLIADCMLYFMGRYFGTRLLEFRWMDFKGLDRTGQPAFGLSGVVSWIGAGTMGSSYAHLNCLLPNFGVGYRIVVQGRMAIRLDMGAGRESTGFYFSFNEAF